MAHPNDPLACVDLDYRNGGLQRVQENPGHYGPFYQGYMAGYALGTTEERLPYFLLHIQYLKERRREQTLAGITILAATCVTASTWFSWALVLGVLACLLVCARGIEKRIQQAEQAYDDAYAVWLKVGAAALETRLRNVDHI